MSGDPLVWQERGMFITCEPIVDDEPIVEVDNPSIARLIRVEDNSTEWWKHYNAYFDILAEWDFAVIVKSKNNPSVMNAKMYHSITPTPIETFSFNEDTITIPENRTVFTSATFTPSDAYVWQWLDISAPEGDTNLQIYNWTRWYINLYGYSSAPAWAMRTLSAKSFSWPVLDTVEADVVEVVEPTSITFVEHNITLTIWQEVSPEVIKSPSDTNVNLILQPNDWSVAWRWFTPFSIVGQGAWTTQVDLIDWDTSETYDTCEVTVEAPVYPTIEFVDWDTEINVWETWTLRFRYTNATSFSSEDDPFIANVTNISSDGEYCYITYEWVSDWVCHISAIAWNWDINISAWVQVTVVWAPLEPVTSINQFSTDYTTIAGKYAMRNLWTVTPSEGADINSIARGMPHELNVQETKIENWTLYAVVFGDEWDWNLYVTLQNWNQYVYTFHIQPDIPVESIEEHFAYNIDVSLWGAVTTEFSYLPTNATNFSGITWRWSVWAEEIAQPWGWRYDNWTLYRNINWIGEWNCTLTWMLNDVWFTTVNVTVVPTVPYEISGLSEQSVTATVWVQRDVNVSGNSNANSFDAIQVTSSDENIARASFSWRIDSFWNSTLYIHPQSEWTCTITISDWTNSFDCNVTVTEPAPAHPTITGVESDNVTVDTEVPEARVAFYYSWDWDENDFSVTSSDEHIIEADIYDVYDWRWEIVLRHHHDTWSAVVTLSDWTNNFDINVTVAEWTIPIEYLEDVDTSEKTVEVWNTVDSSFSFRPRDATDKSMITVVSSDELVATATYDARRRYNAKVIITWVWEWNCTITLSEWVNNFEIPVVVTEQLDHAD